MNKCITSDKLSLLDYRSKHPVHARKSTYSMFTYCTTINRFLLRTKIQLVNKGPPVLRLDQFSPFCHNFKPLFTASQWVQFQKNLMDRFRGKLESVDFRSHNNPVLLASA